MKSSEFRRWHMAARQVAGINPDGDAVVFELAAEVADKPIVSRGVEDENVVVGHGRHPNRGTASA